MSGNNQWIVDEVGRIVMRAHMRSLASERFDVLLDETVREPTMRRLIEAHRLYADAEEQSERCERVAVWTCKACDQTHLGVDDLAPSCSEVTPCA